VDLLDAPRGRAPMAAWVRERFPGW